MLGSTWGWMTSLSGPQPGLEEPVLRNGDAGCTTSGATSTRGGIPHGLALGLGMPEGEEERALAAAATELPGRWGGTARPALDDHLAASMAARESGDGAERECVRARSMPLLNGSSGSSGSTGSGGRSSSSSRGHSSSSRSSNYAVDPDWLPWREEKHVLKTSMGQVTITVWGDRCKPALITYHDVGLNHTTCFQGLFLCPDTAALLLDAFCVYHVDCPGHETGSEDLDMQVPAAPFLRVEDMAAQVGEVIDQLSLKQVTCLGVAAGAYVLLLLALARPELVERLILVSPILKAPTWAEWLHTKMLTSMLFFAGMCDAVKDALLHRYFCEDQSGFHGPGCDARIAFCMELEERQAGNVIRYLEAMQDRLDLSPLVSELHCDCLIAVGERAPFYSEAVELWELLEPASHCLPGCMLPPAVVAGKVASTRTVKAARVDALYSAGAGKGGRDLQRTVGFVAVPACSSLVTEERPHTLLKPLEELLKLSFSSGAGNGTSPSSVLCTSCNNSPSPSPSIMQRVMRTSSSSSTGGTLSSSSSLESRLSSADVADCMLAEHSMGSSQDCGRMAPGALPDWQLAGAVPGQSGIADRVTLRAYPHGHEHSSWASMMLHMMLPLRKSPPSEQDLSLRDAAASLKLRPIRTGRASSRSQSLHGGLHRSQQQQQQPSRQAMQQLQDAAAMAAAALKQQRQAQDPMQQQHHHHWLLSFLTNGAEGQAEAAGPARGLIL